jgi:tetratricopeptide (TPR) repeat protein
MPGISRFLGIIISLLIIFGCKKEESEYLKPITDKEQAILDYLHKYDFTKFRLYTFEKNKDEQQAAIHFNNKLFVKMYETFQGKSDLCCVTGSGRTIEGDMIYTYYIVTPGEFMEIIDARRDMYGLDACVIKRRTDYFTLAQWKSIDDEMESSILVEIDKDNYDKDREIIPVFYEETFEEIASAASKHKPVAETPPEARTLYRKGENFEKAGEYVKADIAYEKAIKLSKDQRFQAKILYRLFQNKRKQGETFEAKNILARLTNDFSPSTIIYANDYPVPWSHMDQTLETICSEFNEFYLKLPVEVKVEALKSRYASNENAKFKVSIKNITQNKISLVCSRQDIERPLVPIKRPYIIINDSSSIYFDETCLLSKKMITDVTIIPNGTFSYIGSLNLINLIDKSGMHVFEFRIELILKLKNGKKWQHSILANSVVLNIEKYPNKKKSE